MRWMHYGNMVHSREGG